MIESFKLSFEFDIKRLKADFAHLNGSRWLEHFNTNEYNGSWSGIALRSPGGEESIYPDPSATKEYSDTILMSECDYIPEVLSEIQCPVKSVRLLKLDAGAEIKPHRDHTLCFEDGEVRLHIPIITNSLVEFISNGNRLELKEGECWYINASQLHSVANRGTEDRIHLILDCEVNDWLRIFFPAVEKSNTIGMESIRSENDKENMIASLRQLGTPAALEIIDTMLSATSK